MLPRSAPPMTARITWIAIALLPHTVVVVVVPRGTPTRHHLIIPLRMRRGLYGAADSNIAPLEAVVAAAIDEGAVAHV